MLFTLKRLALITVLAALSGAAFADYNYYVVPPGTPGVPANPDYLSWETAGTSIYEGVRLANTQHVGKDPYRGIQHTLFVKSGFYLVTNELALGDCTTTIRSSKGPGAEMEIDREGTILCGGYPATANRILTVSAGSVSRPIQFRGFTVTNGYSTGRGGGVRFIYSARSDTGIFDCTVVDCHALLGCGGGIDYSPDNCGVGIISNCFVHSCTASNKFEKGYGQGQVGGGGIVFGQNGAATYATAASRNYGLRIFDTVISNNVVYGNSIYPSGLWLRNYGSWIENCTIISNRAYAFKNGNMSYAAGIGGANVRCTYLNLRVEGNYSENSQGAGPGLHAGVGSVVSNCVVKDNWGRNNGQIGIVTLNSSIAAYQSGKLVYTNPVKFVSCVIDGNCGSGMTAISPGYQSILRNNFITHCTGYSGQIAPINLSDGSVRCENNTFAGNSKGVVCVAAGTGRMVNCALDNDWNVHQATKSASQVGITFSNCWISARSKTDQPKYNCLTMSVADAKLVDPANGDYRLKRLSPLREAALKLDWMTNATDLDGNPRILDKAGLRTTSALPDIGCYECTIKIKGFRIIVR